jgi:hypothetical protein
VTQKAGSFAQTKLPAAVTGNTFNSANEMTAFNGTPQTYDANGNLTNTLQLGRAKPLTEITSTASFAMIRSDCRAQETINCCGNITLF